MLSYYCATEQATQELGRALAAVLGEGDVLCLTGDLGAGKTCLATALATALGVEPATISSPTFALMNIYQGRLEVKHFDLYRLNSLEELDDIGFEEYVGTEGVTLIEWGELFESALPTEYLQLVLRREGEGRRVELVPHGEHYVELSERVLEHVNAGN